SVTDCLIALYVYVYMYFFFFSSRRRHTRFSRDWSSDVCSSDLLHKGRIHRRTGPMGQNHYHFGLFAIAFGLNQLHIVHLLPLKGYHLATRKWVSVALSGLLNRE